MILNLELARYRVCSVTTDAFLLLGSSRHALV